MIIRDDDELFDWVEAGRISFFNFYRRKQPDQKIDFSGRVFTAKLIQSGINLDGVDLRGADFSKGNISIPILKNAIFDKNMKFPSGYPTRIMQRFIDEHI